MNYNKRPVIYIGYDKREEIAYNVLKYSIERFNTDYDIIPLHQPTLRRLGLYRRNFEVNKHGQKIDTFDNLPFSTDFTFTRFLVPHISLYSGWSLFMDSDTYLRTDIKELFATYNDPKYALYCIKHHYMPTETMKMDGQLQQSYSRKNWSSVVLWNCSHPSNKNLTVDDVNTKSGRWLHNFKWLEDQEIGSMSEEWNWLDGHTDQDISPYLVHFTTGGPWFPKWVGKREDDVKYAEEWKAIHDDMSYGTLIGE